MTTSESDAIFSTLADPTRRAILSLIGEHEELTAGEIAAHFDALGRTAVSSHLRILRLAGLVAERFRHYSVTPSPADAVVAFLTSVYQNSLEQLASAVQDASVAGGAPSGRAEKRSA